MFFLNSILKIEYPHKITPDHYLVIWYIKRVKIKNGYKGLVELYGDRKKKKRKKNGRERGREEEAEKPRREGTESLYFVHSLL